MQMAPFLKCKAVVPGMTERKLGRIVNVTITTFWLNVPDLTACIASKGGMIGFSRPRTYWDPWQTQARLRKARIVVGRPHKSDLCTKGRCSGFRFEVSVFNRGTCSH